MASCVRADIQQALNGLQGRCARCGLAGSLECGWFWGMGQKTPTGQKSGHAHGSNPDMNIFFQVFHLKHPCDLITASTAGQVW